MVNDEQITELIAEAKHGSVSGVAYALADALTQVKAERDEAWRVGAGQHGYDPTDDEQAGNYMRLAKRADRAETEIDVLREQVAARDAVIAEALGYLPTGRTPMKSWDAGEVYDANCVDEAMDVLESAPESVLAERDAEKWDEGEQAGLRRADYEYGVIGFQHVKPNPYRKAAGA